MSRAFLKRNVDQRFVAGFLLLLDHWLVRPALDAFLAVGFGNSATSPRSGSSGIDFPTRQSSSAELHRSRYSALRFFVTLAIRSPRPLP
jgi:hypothetical protein